MLASFIIVWLLASIGAISMVEQILSARRPSVKRTK